jgi:2-polyprenyl-3-methyl-5-hydroxy-6-metoxy-1,4-benzoquinol methylase
MGYYDNVNEDLLRSIPPDATKVCEVGCGTGEMAHLYKQINPDGRYYGIELDFNSYREASERRHVFADIVNSDCEKIWGYHYGMLAPDLDVLIYGDTLEHLKDPWSHLTHAVTEWVKPGGQVIACVPNSQNFGFIEALMAGEFHYQDDGLLDRTHLRFFTRKTLIEMFEQAGLSVVSVEPRNWSSDFNGPHSGFMKRTEDFVEAFGLDAKEFRGDTRAFQWLIKGVKGEPPARKILIRAISSNHCCRRPRLTEPGNFLATIPGVRFSGVETEVRPDETPVVIIQRDAFKIEQVRKLIHSGVLVIGEWDDWPGHFTANIETNYLPLKAVHAISATTNTMAETLMQWNPNIGVFANQMASLPPVKTVNNDPPIIFCAWQNRSDDWKPIIDGFNAALEDHPEVQVYIIGDREFYHAVRTDNKRFWTFQPYDKYIQLLRECDIAVLPMIDSVFSQHKSDIKFLECAANGVSVLAPIESIYIKSVWSEPMRGTLFFNEEFEDALRECIEGVSCLDHATAARKYVASERLLKDHYRDRLRWINALIDTREELTEQLFERCPELR